MLDIQFPQNEVSLPHTSEFHCLPRVSSEQLCALAHLGRTFVAGTS